MKLRNLFFASLAMVTFAACSNDDEPGIENNEPQDASAVVFKVRTATSNETKAVTKASTEGGTEIETAVTDLTVYIFQNNDYVGKTSVSTEASNITDIEGYDHEKLYGVTISGLKTGLEYKFVAIANNHATISGNPSYSDFSKLIQAYNVSSFAMIGEATYTPRYSIKETQEDETKVNELSSNIQIARVLAAIEVAEVKIDFTNIPENFDPSKATLEEIYMVNVKETAVSKSPFENNEEGVSIKHGSLYELNSSATDKDKNPNYFASFRKVINQSLDGEGITTALNRIYTAPSSGTTENKVMLKLRVKYEGAAVNEQNQPTDAYRTYTVYIQNNQLKNNTLYRIKATLTGIGSPTDSEVQETASDITATIEQLPWTLVEQNEGNLTD